MVKFFNKIREIFGMNSNFTETPIELFDKAILEETKIEDDLKKAKSSYDEDALEISFKIKACDKIIEIDPNSSTARFNKSALETKLAKITENFTSDVSELNNKKKSISDDRQSLESDILSKSLEIIAAMTIDEQEIVKASMEEWNKTGLIKGEPVDHQMKAIIESIDVVLKASEITEVKKKVVTLPNPFLD